MRGITRGWAGALTVVTVAAGLAGCTGGGDGDRKAAARSSAPTAVAKACANGSFTWTGVEKTDRLTGVTAPEPSGDRTIRTTNPIERVYTPKPSVRTEGPSLSAAEVLKFRDEAWQTYFRNPAFLSLIEKKFGATERNNIEQMSEIRLKRQLLGD